MNDPKMTYTYLNKETGDRLQRTFALSEIKRGEDDAHLKLIPGYELHSIVCPLCGEFAVAAAAIHGGLNMRGEPGIPQADFFAKRAVQQGIDKLEKHYQEWQAQNPF